MSNLWLAICTLAIANPFVAVAFCFGGRQHPLLRSSSWVEMSSPGGGDGDWDNDEFLNSLSGGGGNDATNENEVYGYDQGGGSSPERIVPENEMSDEEITMMAMRAAQFYNTDTSLEEAYGVPRQGPPKKQEGEEGSA